MQDAIAQQSPNFSWKNDMKLAKKLMDIRIKFLENTGNVDCCTRAKFKRSKLEKKLKEINNG